MRSLQSWLGWFGLALFFAAGCGGGGGGGEGSGQEATDEGAESPDAEGGSADGGDTTLIGDAGESNDDGSGEGEAGGDTAQPVGTLELAVVTTRGLLGAKDAPISLGMADEFAVYTEEPGLQFDVVATMTNIPVGETLRLNHNGVWIANAVAVARPDGDGTLATFAAVTLASGQHELVASVVSGRPVADAKLTVEVKLGTCGVNVLPQPGSCVSEDYDPLTPGFQVRFEVSTGDPDCTDARVWIPANGEPREESIVVLNNGSGAVVLTVKLQDAQVDDLQVVVLATVENPRNPSRNGSSGPMSYTFDNTAPSVALLPLPANPLALVHDADQDPNNGLQVEVEAKITGTFSGTAALWLDGTAITTATPGADGAVNFGQLTFEGDGPRIVGVSVKDFCGNTGDTEVAVDVYATPAEVELVSPLPGSGPLLAADDEDLETPFVFETTFDVWLAPGTISGVLAVECRRPPAMSAWTVVGALDVDSALPAGVLWSIPVAVDVQAFGGVDVACRARFQGPNPIVGEALSYVFAVPWPSVAIAAPQEGAWVTADALDVTVFGEHLAGEMLAVGIYDLVGNTVWATGIPNAFVDGLATLTIPLDGDLAQLPDGTYRVEVAAFDPWGNSAAENPKSAAVKSFKLDRSPPAGEWLAPATALFPLTNPEHFDASLSTPGYQIYVEIGVDAGTVQACASHDAAPPLCVTPPADGGIARIGPFTLDAGTHLFGLSARDAAGNTWTYSDDVEVALGPISVTWAEPAQSEVTAAQSIYVDVSVTADGGLPVLGPELTLQKDGAPLPTEVVSLGLGKWRLGLVPLEPGPNSLQVDAKAVGVVGIADPLTVTYKNVEPGITLAPLSSDAVLNRASTLCDTDTQQCVFDFEATLTQTEDGSPSWIAVSCGAEKFTVKAQVEAGKAQFAPVSLLNGATCTFQASVEDAAGQVATVPPFTVSADLVAPNVAFVSDLDGQYLLAQDDQDPATPGIQRELLVRVEGLEQGQNVVLTVEADEAGITTELAPVLSTIPDGAPEVLSFGMVTIPDGAITLVLFAQDSAGNPAAQVQAVVNAHSPSASIAFSPVMAPSGAPCTEDFTCPWGELCEEGACGLAWNAQADQTIRLVVSDTPGGPGAQLPVRICSNQPGAGTSPCNAPGFSQVATSVAVSGTNNLLSLEGLGQGAHSFVAELELWPGSAKWISTQSGGGTPTLDVFIDTIPPSVEALTVVSDTLPPQGAVGVAETAPGGAVVFSVTSSETGKVELWVDGAPVIDTWLDAPGLVAPFAVANLAYGERAVQALVIDRVRNESPSPLSPLAPALPLWVDLVAPTASIVSPGLTVFAGEPEWPDADPNAAGFQTPLIATLTDGVATNIPSVCWSLDGQELGCATDVAAGNQSLDTVTLQPGINTIEVSVADIPQNTGTVTSNVWLEGAGARVVGQAPAPSSVTLDAEVSVVVSVDDPFGAEPPQVLSATLVVNGVSVDAPYSEPLPGELSFSNIPAAAGDNTLLVIVETTVGQGISAPWSFFRKVGEPEVSFVAPAGSQVFALGSPLCKDDPGVAPDDCAISVEVSTELVEQGQLAELELSCAVAGQPAAAQSFTSEVEDGAAAFDDIVLPNGAECTAQVTVTDIAMQTASTPAVTWRVDRTSPAFGAWQTPSGDALLSGDDQEPGTPGMQVALSIEVNESEPGQTISFEVFKGTQLENTFSATLGIGTEPGSTAVATTEVVNLPEGWVRIVASTTDSAGNVAVDAETEVYVRSGLPLVSVDSPVAVPATPCDDALDCIDSGCISGGCTVVWNAAAVRKVVVSTTDLYDPELPLLARLCTSAPNPGGQACAQGGFTVMQSATLNAESLEFDLSDAPEGELSLYVEVEELPGGAFVVSHDAVTAPATVPTVFIDTVPPVAPEGSLPNDLAPTGVLSLNEEYLPGVFEVSVEAPGAHRLELFLDGVSVAIVPGPAASIPFDPGADGNKVLTFVSYDEAQNASPGPGEPGASTLEVLVDRSPVDVALEWPPTVLNPVLNSAHADELLADGYQTSPSVSFGGALTQALTVCLSLGGAQVECKAADIGDATLTFAPVTLSVGNNALSVVASDGSGNADQSSRVVQLQWADPVVSWTSPLNGAWTASSSTNVVFSVTDGSTGLPVPAISLTVVRNDTTVFLGSLSNAGGNYSQSTSLAAGGNVIAITVAAGGRTASTLSRAVNYKDTVPALALAQPMSGTVYNLASAACQVGSTPCLTTIVASATHLSNGTAATLNRTCNGVLATANSTVAAGAVSFANVTLPHAQTCTLQVSATDEAGQVAQASGTVQVDRVAPVLSSLSPSLEALVYYNDQDLVTPGMQRAVSVGITGLEAGRVVTLQISEVGEPTQEYTATVGAAVADTLTTTLNFGTLTLPQGDLTFTLTVSDAAGNPATPLVRQIFVNSEEPAVALVLPANVSPAACATSATCGAGNVCRNGTCWTGWSTATSRSAYIETADFPWETKTITLRVCSNHPSYAAGTPCSEGGYFVALSKPLANIGETVNLSSLPDGGHTIYAEAELYPDSGEWIQSLDAPLSNQRSRVIWIDTVAPSISSIVATSDTLAPANVLNLAERAGDGTYAFQASITEDGTATFFRNTTEMTTTAVTGGTTSTSFSLGTDGAKTIGAVARDELGNASPAVTAVGATTLALTLKATPPTLAFPKPSSSPLLVGADRNVKVTTDANTAVVVTNGGAAFLSGTSDGTGVYEVTNALVDGTYTLSATVTDFANNAVTMASSPATVVVDTSPPTVSLTSPAPGQYVDADDAAPAQGGYQLTAQFTNTDAASWSIRLQSGCTAAFTNCQPAVTLVSGNLTPAGSVVPPQTITIPATGAPYYVVTARVVDANGNVATSSSNIEVTLSNCVVSLLGLPTDGILNGGDCVTPGCTSLELNAEIQFVGPCGAVTDVALYKNGVLVGVDADVGDSTGIIPVTLNNGDDVTLEAFTRISGADTDSSGGVAVRADFTAPTVQFVAATVDGFDTAASDDVVTYGLDDDQNGGANGLQFHVRVQATDNVALAGELIDLSYTAVGGAGGTFSGITVPTDLTAFPVTNDYKFLTLSDQQSYEVVAKVADAAGNQGEARFEVSVDLLPPEPVTVQIAATHARRPMVDLEWDAPFENSDGTGGAASAYEVRYSKAAITTEAEWDAACPSDVLEGALAYPAPQAPGTLGESYSVSGPDGRSAAAAGDCKFVVQPTPTDFYFAVRAQDDAGNWSALAGGSVVSTDALHLDYAKVTTSLVNTGKDRLTQNAMAVGDLNSDGFDDVAFGGSEFSGFCILYGHAAFDGSIANFSISATSSANHDCILDGADTGLGTQIAAAGDVNGDGADDIIVSAGYSSVGYAARARVYLGTTNGTFISHTPALTITGISTNFLLGAPIGAGGNFNGDVHSTTGHPLNDLVVGSNLTALRAFVIPGAASWPASTLDLTNAADLTSFGVVTIQQTGATGNNFASRVTIVGDVWQTPGTVYDELALHQTGGNHQVVIVKGRATTPGVASTLTFTFNTDGTGANDLDVMRLRYDATAVNTSFFPFRPARSADVDGDGYLDVLVGHGRDTRLYVFDGASIQSLAGQEVRVAGVVGNAIGDAVPGTRGHYIAADGDSPAFVGNFDDDALVPGGTPDLVYSRFSTGSTFGWVDLRFNVLGSGGSLRGLYSHRDVRIESPSITMTTTTALGASLSPIGDFNGDDLPDFVVGTASTEGFALIVY